MFDPGALGTLIIRNNAEIRNDTDRVDAARVVAGTPGTIADDDRSGIRVALARGLRRVATSLAGPEPMDRPPMVGSDAPSLRLTWTDR